ncbi:hypothetical protein DFH06DRAFT_182590 [Mycena polygramma]|nr:hypothetical protein DFH06DRAFT_182590 [Mycena polygramma]
MSPVSAANGITEKRFADMPAIPGCVLTAVEQAKASDGASTKSGGTTPLALPREEGCLLTQSINYANELAHFIAAGEEKEKERLITMLEFELKVIPDTLLLSGFDPEHASNRAWLTPLVHKHHDIYASIAISPCLADLLALEASFSADNQLRQAVINRRGVDSGRRAYDDIMKNTTLTDRFELVVLHPMHFLIQDETLKIYRNGVGVDYHASPEGILEDPQNVPLPPFPLRVPRDNASSKMNPVLVNFAAATRFRRFRRISSPPLGQHAEQVIDASLALWRAIMWKPAANQSSTLKTAAGAVSPQDVPLGPHSDTAVFLDAFTGASTETRMTMMDYLLGGYDFEELPELSELIPDDGSTSSSRSTTPTDASVAANGRMENASRG